MKKRTLVIFTLLMCCLVLFVSCDETNKAPQATNPQTTEQPDPCANGHTEVIDAAVAPTCTEKGKTEGKHCSVCNEDLVAQTDVDALGHTEVTDAAVAPTCTENGKTEGKHCSVCNEILVAQKDVDALGHTEVTDAAVAPTCTEKGKTEGKHCSWCNTITVAQSEVDATGHTAVTDVAVAPTCTEEGITEGEHCSVCNVILVARSAVDALGHSYGEWSVTTPATCTEKGEQAQTCSVCNDVRKREIDANGHTNKEPVVENQIDATCTVDGSYDSVIYCSVCNAEVSREKQTITAPGHTYGEWTQTLAPTCTEKGSERRDCSLCDHFETRAIDATGHSWSNATCTAPKTCSVCKITQGNALGHSWRSATCTSPKTCTKCSTTEGSALGHSWKSATCTFPKTCGTCGITEGSALGHSWSGTTCTRCYQTKIVYYSGTSVPAFGNVFSTFLSPTTTSNQTYFYSFKTVTNYDPEGNCIYDYDELLTNCGYRKFNSFKDNNGDTVIVYRNSSSGEMLTFSLSTRSSLLGFVVMIY